LILEARTLTKGVPDIVHLIWDGTNFNSLEAFLRLADNTSLPLTVDASKPLSLVQTILQANVGKPTWISSKAPTNQDLSEIKDFGSNYLKNRAMITPLGHESTNNAEINDPRPTSTIQGDCFLVCLRDLNDDRFVESGFLDYVWEIRKHNREHFLTGWFKAREITGWITSLYENNVEVQIVTDKGYAAVPLDYRNGDRVRLVLYNTPTDLHWAKAEVFEPYAIMNPKHGGVDDPSSNRSDSGSATEEEADPTKSIYVIGMSQVGKTSIINNAFGTSFDVGDGGKSITTFCQTAIKDGWYIHDTAGVGDSWGKPHADYLFQHFESCVMKGTYTRSSTVLLITEGDYPGTRWLELLTAFGRAMTTDGRLFRLDAPTEVGQPFELTYIEDADPWKPVNSYHPETMADMWDDFLLACSPSINMLPENIGEPLYQSLVSICGEFDKCGLSPQWAKTDEESPVGEKQNKTPALSRSATPSIKSEASIEDISDSNPYILHRKGKRIDVKRAKIAREQARIKASKHEISPESGGQCVHRENCFLHGEEIDPYLGSADDANGGYINSPDFCHRYLYSWTTAENPWPNDPDYQLWVTNKRKCYPAAWITEVHNDGNSLVFSQSRDRHLVVRQ